MKLRTRLALATFSMTIPVVVAVLWLDARARHEATREALTNLTRTEMRGQRELCEQDPAHWGGRPLPPPDGDRGPRARPDRPLGMPPPPGPPPDRAGAAANGPPNSDRGPHDRMDGAPGMPPPPGLPPDRDRGPGVPPRLPSFRVGGAPPMLFAYDAQLRADNPNAPKLSGPPEPPLWPGATVVVLIDMPWQTGPCARILARGTTNPNWIGGLLPQSPIWLMAIGAIWLALAFSLGTVVRRIRSLTRAVRQSAQTGFTGSVPVLGTDEISELAHAFDAASQEVRKQLHEAKHRERALREYVANTTHDVMIPLTVLRSHLAAIEDRARAGEPFDHALLAQAMSEADYLGALTTNLGVASKLDAGEPAVVRTQVDLRALVERVLARHRTIARQLGVSLDGAVPEQPVELSGDVTLIEQAVNNLVHNAIRYNRAGGHVALVLDRFADRFVITVADDGPGIPDDELGKITDRGFRGNAARTRSQGQGLGLAIVKRVATLMGFSFALRNADGGGLEATLTGDLPVQAAHAPGPLDG